MKQLSNFTIKGKDGENILVNIASDTNHIKHSVEGYEGALSSYLAILSNQFDNLRLGTESIIHDTEINGKEKLVDILNDQLKYENINEVNEEGIQTGNMVTIGLKEFLEKYLTIPSKRIDYLGENLESWIYTLGTNLVEVDANVWRLKRRIERIEQQLNIEVSEEDKLVQNGIPIASLDEQA